MFYGILTISTKTDISIERKPKHILMKFIKLLIKIELRTTIKQNSMSFLIDSTKMVTNSCRKVRCLYLLKKFSRSQVHQTLSRESPLLFTLSNKRDQNLSAWWCHTLVSSTTSNLQTNLKLTKPWANTREWPLEVKTPNKPLDQMSRLCCSNVILKFTLKRWPSSECLEWDTATTLWQTLKLLGTLTSVSRRLTISGITRQLRKRMMSSISLQTQSSWRNLLRL